MLLADEDARTRSFLADNPAADGLSMLDDEWRCER
jgi:hypothetical protein